jgi:sortase A
MLKGKKIQLSLLLVLFITGIFLVSKSGYAIIHEHYLAKQQIAEAKKITHRHVQHNVSMKEPSHDKEKSLQANLVTYKDKPVMGETIGLLTIPSLEAELPIIHGTDEDDLEKGVGHYADSVLPGENDNSVLAGHRDTVFRKLGDLKIGDLLVTKTKAGEFTYKIKKMQIVDKEDRSIIVPSTKATLTLSTCYPFHFIGPAPKRYIITSLLIKRVRIPVEGQ